jgi:FdhE protein
MTQPGPTQGLMSIGEEAKPPYAVLPDPFSLFLDRSKRLRQLAPGHALEPYLNFVALVTETQHEIQARLPGAALPKPEQLEQALEHGMPPLLHTTFVPDEATETILRLLLEKLSASEIPKEAANTAQSLIEAPQERRQQLLNAALKNLPPDGIAERVLALAALQVHFARLAAKLNANDLRPIADGICPACGSAPMTTAVVGWPGAHNTRFCACSLCGTRWNVVRIKCVLCSSTEAISYQSVEGQPDSIKAETCDKCHRYVKILYQVNDHVLDPLSDDVASLGLDMLLAKEGWERGGENLFLLGY